VIMETVILSDVPDMDQLILEYVLEQPEPAERFSDVAYILSRKITARIGVDEANIRIKQMREILCMVIPN